MKAILTISSAQSTDIKQLMERAASAGSDNGLSGNYLTVVTPIIIQKQVNEQSNPYGAFITLLFDKSGKYVKSGSVSISRTQRTENLCDALPENCTVEMTRAFPQVEVIAGSSRTNGKSAYETVKGWFDSKAVIEKIGEKNIVSLGFKAQTPTMDGARIKKANLFAPNVNEAVFEQIPEVLKELIDPSQDANVKSHFEAANIEIPYSR